MKVYGKYLVIFKNGDGQTGIAASFMTKKEAIAALDTAFHTSYSGVWFDHANNQFHIEKNTKEYK